MNFFFLNQSNTIQIIIMPVHHSTLNIQFVIVGYRKVNFRHACKYSYQYNGASFSCILDCLSHGNIIAGTVIDDICLIRTECLNHSLSKIFFGSIDAYINSTFFRFFQTQIAYIRNHYLVGAHSFCSLCH